MAHFLFFYFINQSGFPSTSKTMSEDTMLNPDRATFAITPITRALVLALFYDCNEDHNTAFERIRSIALHQNINCDNVNETTVRLPTRRVLTQMNKYKKNVSRNWLKINKFLNESFCLPSPRRQPRLPTAVEEDDLPPAVKKITTDDWALCMCDTQHRAQASKLEVRGK